MVCAGHIMAPGIRFGLESVFQGFFQIGLQASHVGAPLAVEGLFVFAELETWATNNFSLYYGYIGFRFFAV